MADKNNWEKRLSDNSLTILVVILLVAVISAVLVIGFYVAYFRGMAPAATWGQVGDFFGGTLNPIFGFLSVMALLAALVIQSRELKVSTQELRNSAQALDAQNKAIAHQSFEQTFFSWLKSYRDSVNEIEYPSGGKVFNGRKAMYSWWELALGTNSVAYEYCRIKGVQKEGFSWEQYFDALAEEDPIGMAELALKQWEGVYQLNEYQLDSLFRNLYRLILWVHSQDEDRINRAQKWLYISIVRAQLSWTEMVLLFYNGYTYRGAKFKRLVEQYALFDNLNMESAAVIKHLRLNPPNGGIYDDSAFDSGLARKNMGLAESSEEVLELATVIKGSPISRPASSE